MQDPHRSASLDWEDIRFFTVLARHRSLAAAARTLGTPTATVELRLANLEASLGYPLFNRGPNGLALSSAGCEALAEAAQMEMAACSLGQKRPGVP